MDAQAQQLPLRFKSDRKTDVRAQFAALCWRYKKGKLQICLVTSRTRKRWIIPKGWPMHKYTPAKAAAIEAFEEAGLSGRVSDNCIGIYSYNKLIKSGEIPTLAMVYAMQVQKVHKKWPEKKERKRKWFSPKKAAKKLLEPELQEIVATFHPTGLRQ